MVNTKLKETITLAILYISIAIVAACFWISLDSAAKKVTKPQKKVTYTPIETIHWIEPELPEQSVEGCPADEPEVVEPDPEPQPEPEPVLEGEELYRHWIDELTADDPESFTQLIKSQVFFESTYNPNACSSSGAIGLMQVVPKWNYDRMERLGVTDLYDPYSNLKVGIDLMRELVDKYGSYSSALMSYNGGDVYAKRMIAAGKVSEYANNILSNL